MSARLYGSCCCLRYMCYSDPVTTWPDPIYAPHLPLPPCGDSSCLETVYEHPADHRDAPAVHQLLIRA